MIRSLLFSALLTLACPAQEVAAAAADLWPVSQILAHPPAMEMGAADGLTQEVWYEGEPLAGKPTRIFAYLGKPAQPEPASPAMLLVHGGGGRAFKEWAQHWAARGYVALAMDTAGQGPDGRRHANAGPDQSDATKFQECTEAQARDQWSYHAVAAVLRGHALLKLAQQIGLNVTTPLNALQKAQSLNTAEIIMGVPAEDRSNGERIRSAIDIARLAAITTALSI
jgi:hypothetical protein